MDRLPGSNPQTPISSIFDAVNNYFLLLFCASCVISSLYVQAVFYTMGHMRWGIICGAVIGMILPSILLLRRFPAGVGNQLQIRVPRPRLLLNIVISTLAVVVLVDNVYLFTQQFLPTPDTYNEDLASIRPDSVQALILTALGLCVAVPIAEELIFRGYVQQIFERNMGKISGFLLAGAIFGAFHMAKHLLVSVTLFGIFLGFVYMRTRNLVYPIVSHAVFNLVALAQLMTMEPGGESVVPFYLSELWVLGVAIVVLGGTLIKINAEGSDNEPPAQDVP